MSLSNQVMVIAGTQRKEVRDLAGFLTKAGAEVYLMGKAGDGKSSEMDHFFPCSLENPVEIRKCLEEIKVQAGKLEHVLIWEEREEFYQRELAVDTAWANVFETQVKAGFFLAEEAGKVMKEEGGNILFLYTTEAYVSTGRYPVIYSLAQGAIRTMVRVLAEELGPYDINVNGIAAARGKAGEKNLLHYPVHGFVETAELAEAAEFLCTPDASYISGNTITLDSGNLLTYRRYALGK